MANITELNAPAGLTLAPEERAAQTAREAGRTKDILFREAGRSLGTAISTVGQVGEKIENQISAQQIGHGSSVSSALWADLTTKINKAMTTADPNDVSIGPGLKEQLIDPALENFQKQFESSTRKTQEWALKTTDHMRGHFYNSITSHEMTRAATAVGKNIGDLQRNLSVVVGNDPAALPDVITKFDTDLKDIIAGHNLSGEAQAAIQKEIPKLKERIAAASFAGMAQRAPNAAISALDRGDFNEYADAVTQKQWRAYAEGQHKIQKQDEREDRLANQRDVNENSAARAEEYRTKMYNPDTGRILRVQPKLNQQIVADMNSGLMTKKDGTELIRWNEQQYAAQLRADKAEAEGAPLRNNEKVLADLRKRVGDPDQPTTRQEVGDALAAGMLTTKAAHDLAWRVGQEDAGWLAMQRPFKQQFENLKHIAMTSVTSMVKYLPPEEQLARLNQAEADAQRVVKAAFDSRDKQLMRDVLDPKSSKWAFKEAMSQLIGSPKAAVKDQANVERRSSIDIGAEREKVSAAIAAGVPEAAAKARFKERTGQEFAAPAVNPSAAKIVHPETYAEFEIQQEGLRPAVQAKGWEWNPDRWNYSLDENGQLQREQSPGRAWIKANYAAVMKQREITR